MLKTPPLPFTQAQSCTGNDLWWNVTGSKQTTVIRYDWQWVKNRGMSVLWRVLIAMPFSVAAGCWSLENEQDGNVAFICTPSNWGSKPPCHAHQISKPRFQQVPHCLLLIQQQARGYTLLATPRCELTHTETETDRMRVWGRQKLLKQECVSRLCQRCLCIKESNTFTVLTL